MMANTLYDVQEDSRKSHDKWDSTAQFIYNGVSREVRQIISQPQDLLDWKSDRRRGFLIEGRKRTTQWLSSISRSKVTLIVIWILVLWWGERLVFWNSVSRCRWEQWEQWPPQAVPHHVVLLADPQLVDPHTYPGRPWPLSTLTIRHTDLYLRRSFFNLQQILEPDTAFFLGDLFDGGREWATGKDQNPDTQWKRYDGETWMKEYDRFGRIFLDTWANGRSRYSEDRRFIASLPGNHDLGIGNGIRLPVRTRFTTYFGEGNRIDFVGNHTFVSVDTVSLSARGQPQSALTAHDSQKAANEEIWETPEAFLSQVKPRKATIIHRELCSRSGRQQNVPHSHTVLELNDPSIGNQTIQPAPDHTPELPSVLLTHVPLYRAPGTPCGPLRERWPPSREKDANGESHEKDDRNAISVSAGHQYQNVLQEDISQELIAKIGNVQHVFSGDDHDYCEVVHHRFTSKGGGLREITVKSMSWAMGVQKPGFLLVSLWNPIDADGNPLHGSSLSEKTSSVTATLSTHLCLLPDQMSIFIRYGLLLGLTLAILGSRAILKAVILRREHSNVNDHAVQPDAPGATTVHVQDRERAGSKSGSSSCKTLNDLQYNGLAARSSTARTRSLSPVTGYGFSTAENPGPFGHERNYNFHTAHKMELESETPRMYRSGFSAIWHELRQSIAHVALLPILWYVWLAYTS